jgi:hypothetical protein
VLGLYFLRKKFTPLSAKSIALAGQSCQQCKEILPASFQISEILAILKAIPMPD